MRVTASPIWQGPRVAVPPPPSACVSGDFAKSRTNRTAEGGPDLPCRHGRVCVDCFGENTAGVPCNFPLHRTRCLSVPLPVMAASHGLVKARAPRRGSGGGGDRADVPLKAPLLSLALAPAGAELVLTSVMQTAGFRVLSFLL